MDIFGVFALLGGLAMFLYGMSVMGSGLEKMSGGKLEKILENKLDYLLIGLEDIENYCRIQTKKNATAQNVLEMVSHLVKQVQKVG